jgi:phosphotransferase system  glucose/maltose/N-acetylglucosamine-specific IIC component
LLLIIGAVFGVIYYFMFRALIRAKDLATPGRERDAEDLDAAVVAD